MAFLRRELARKEDDERVQKSHLQGLVMYLVTKDTPFGDLTKR